MSVSRLGSSSERAHALAMSKGGVSEKMQRAVRKLQSRIGNPNSAQYYQNLSGSDEASPRSAPARKRSSSGLSRNGAAAAAGDDVDDDDEDKGPADVPEGFLAVYVGREKQRFVISANYLKHHMFKVLLEKSAEEYGFEHKGGLPIACDVAYFEHLLWTIKSKHPGSFQVGRLPICAMNEHRQTGQLMRNLKGAAISNRLLISAVYMHVSNTFHADLLFFILLSESIFYFQIGQVTHKNHTRVPQILQTYCISYILQMLQSLRGQMLYNHSSNLVVLIKLSTKYLSCVRVYNDWQSRKHT